MTTLNNLMTNYYVASAIPPQVSEVMRQGLSVGASATHAFYVLNKYPNLQDNPLKMTSLLVRRPPAGFTTKRNYLHSLFGDQISPKPGKLHTDTYQTTYKVKEPSSEEERHFIDRLDSALSATRADTAAARVEAIAHVADLTRRYIDDKVGLSGFQADRFKSALIDRFLFGNDSRKVSHPGSSDELAAVIRSILSNPLSFESAVYAVVDAVTMAMNYAAEKTSATSDELKNAIDLPPKTRT